MIKKLSKYGNSWALLIDKPILDLLNITEATNLQITTDGVSILVSPIRGEEVLKGTLSKDDKLQKLYETFLVHYGPALKKLSEN